MNATPPGACGGCVLALALLAVLAWTTGSGEPAIPAPAPVITVHAATHDTQPGKGGRLTPQELLAQLRIAPEQPDNDYRREDWGDWGHDEFGCSVHELQLRTDADQYLLGPDLCHVIKGRWISRYDGKAITDRTQLQVDHIVPLREAHRSGANHWDAAKRSEFFNSPENLLTVSAEANQAKSDKDPGTWLPPDESSWCFYADFYIWTKHAYDLTVDQREHDALASVLTHCAGEDQQ